MASFGQSADWPVSSTSRGGSLVSPSISTRGSHSSHLGNHQLASPMSFIDAGTSTTRTIVASTKIAVANPNPIIFIIGSGLATKPKNTEIMINAADPLQYTRTKRVDASLQCLLKRVLRRAGQADDVDAFDRPRPQLALPVRLRVLQVHATTRPRARHIATCTQISRCTVDNTPHQPQQTFVAFSRGTV